MATKTPTKWLIGWFGPDGKFKDAVERTLPGAPRKWAVQRCSEGEQYKIWNISDPAEEKRVRDNLYQFGMVGADYSQSFIDSMTIVKTPGGQRYRCELCKGLFEHKDIKYMEGDCGYTKLCEACWQKPEAQCFLPFMERLSRGLVKSDEIANWNAVHDF